MNRWENELQNSIMDINDHRLSHLKKFQVDSSIQSVIAQYPFLITNHLLNLMSCNEPFDPIRIQFIPNACENIISNEETTDPLNEIDYSPVPGLIHKYRNRVLLMVSQYCAANCRFCFRKHLHIKNRLSRETPFNLPKILDYIWRHHTLNEVILSGGDPLILTDDKLEEILVSCRKIPHIDIIRIHTRVLTSIPFRITESLCQILQKYSPIWLVTHFNHLREITSESRLSLEKLSRSGIPLLNQTTLLKNVNDSYEIQKELNLELVRCRIKPYYIHLLDPAPGTSHFRVSDEFAGRIINKLRQHLQGYAVPQLVRDIPGSASKTLMSK